MARTPQTNNPDIGTSETPISEAMPAPSSGMINPALALAPLHIARDAALGWFECWRIGVEATRDMQNGILHAWRGRSDAALTAIATAIAARTNAQADVPAAAADTPQPANDAAPNAVAQRALAPASFWLSGAQAFTPFATQLGGPWWSALLDHDRRPRA